jgi:subtilisin family serine protease
MLSAVLVATLSLPLLTPAAAPDPGERPLPPVQTDAFGVQWYPGEHGPVLAGTRTDALTLRAPADLDADALSRLAEDVLGTLKPDLSVGLAEPISLQARHGLFVVELTSPLDEPTFRAFAAQLLASPLVTQVHPVLGRATGRAFVDDRLVILADPEQRAAVVAAVLAKTDGHLVRTSALPGAALVEVGAAVGFSAVRAAQELTHDGLPGLRAAEPQLYRELAPLQTAWDDPDYPDQWHLGRHPDATSSVPGMASIDATGAWAVTEGSPDVLVAVFDSGIEVTHPELAPNVVGGIDVIDDDDDASPGCSPYNNGTEPSSNCPDNAPFRDAHGTSVSGLITAVGNNGLSGVGVCPTCKLLPVRFLGAGLEPSLTTAEAFVLAVDDGAAVINNSWGPGGSIYFPVSLAVLTAWELARTEGRDGLGTVITFAAGNETNNVNLHAYAAHPATLAIAASTSIDDWAVYSNYGAQIDVAAPSAGQFDGVDDAGLVCTDALGSDGYTSGDTNPGFSGTSGASPVAAGVAALVIAAQPELTSAQVRLALTSTADKIAADQIDWLSVVGQDIEAAFAYNTVGHSIGFGYGRVNAASAVVADVGALGGECTPDCAECDALDRCLTSCVFQDDCPDGAVCSAGACRLPGGPSDAIGAPCSADCAYCVAAIDTDLVPTDICTDICTADNECPAGFDCRVLDSSGLAICAPGDTDAGEPYDFFDCRNAFYGSRIVVEGDDGQPYCADLCVEDGPGACPYGFHCGAANCDCAITGNFGCRLYECTENAFGNSNWPTPMCFPNEGYGVFCTTDLDCTEGDYCASNNACRLDDREDCPICRPCTSNDDCGTRGICFGVPDEGEGVCTRACVTDNDCAGDGVCRLVDVGFGSAALCTAPGELAEDTICRDDFVCEVACRDDVPCPHGEVCEDSVCVPAPYTRGEIVYLPWPDPEPDGVGLGDPVAGASCRCAGDGRGASWPAAGLGLAIGLLLRRRRRVAPRR